MLESYPISPKLTCFIFAVLKHDGETETEIRWVYDKIATSGALLRRLLKQSGEAKSTCPEWASNARFVYILTNEPVLNPCFLWSLEIEMFPGSDPPADSLQVSWCESGCYACYLQRMKANLNLSMASILLFSICCSKSSLPSNQKVFVSLNKSFIYLC